MRVMGSRAHGPKELAAAAVSTVLSVSPSPSVPPSSADHMLNVSAKSSSASEKPVARIDYSPSPSIGLTAAISSRRRRDEGRSREIGMLKV